MNRAVLRLTGAVAIFATAGPAIASTPVDHHYHVVEIQHHAMVGTEGKPGTGGFRLIDAGVIHGRIGRTAIRGALLAASHLLSAHDSIVHGTEYDAGGSRSFVLHLRFTISGDTSHFRGNGRWVGGTGTYRNARGAFTVTGNHPLDGPGTIKLEGTIVY